VVHEIQLRLGESVLRLGGFLAFAGFVSAILHFTGVQLRILIWAEAFQPVLGLGLGVAGALIIAAAMMSDKNKQPAQQAAVYPPPPATYPPAPAAYPPAQPGYPPAQQTGYPQQQPYGQPQMPAQYPPQQPYGQQPPQQFGPQGFGNRG
jgi:hypothetical protein